MSRLRLGCWAWALAAALTALLAAQPISADASDEGASWRFAPAEAPPAPPGVEPSKFPTALGGVSDIEFWSPNRGLLMTSGNALVSAGLYAYDGRSWHQLSTVCGASDGRIAWAGPDEFWTISNQRSGQLVVGGYGNSLEDVSLCHFANGQVVGSYAMPVEQPDSYRPMNAAACDGPDDCWFGGELGQGTNSGAFHLYWNGSALSVVYSPQDHAIASMALQDGQLYESVQIAPEDTYTSKEKAGNPPLLHTIEPSDPSEVFHNVFPTEAGCVGYCPTLPSYGTDAHGRPVAPDTLSGFALSSDWSQSGDGPQVPQLWALAGHDTTRPPSNEGIAHPLVLRLSGQEWTQAVPNLASFEAGEDPLGIAADPGEQAAWITIQSEDSVAHVDLLSAAEGGGKWEISERAQLGPEQGVGARGVAGPISCPAPHECWMATNEGWLFHLTDGAQPETDTDPFFDGQDGVIAYRPPDNGVPEVLPDTAPEENSLQDQQPPVVATTTAPIAESKVTPKKKALLSHVHTRLLRGDLLELTFTLSGSAHVQLLASRHGSVVARTRKETLRKGSHSLEVRLNPQRWPTKLDLHATAA
jgi:hypothetical protein